MRDLRWAAAVLAVGSLVALAVSGTVWLDGSWSARARDALPPIGLAWGVATGLGALALALLERVYPVGERRRRVPLSLRAWTLALVGWLAWVLTGLVLFGGDGVVVGQVAGLATGFVPAVLLVAMLTGRLTGHGGVRS